MIRQYTEWEDDEDPLVTIRQITQQDEVTYGTLSYTKKQNQDQLGTWVIEAKYDNGLSSLLINLEDVVRQALLQNPAMVANVIRDVNARKALGDSHDMGI